MCSAAKPQEILQKAEKKEARQLTDVERKRIREREEATFRELRLFLRDVINKLGKDRKFAMFAKPVDITEVIMCVLRCCYQNLSSKEKVKLNRINAKTFKIFQDCKRFFQDLACS